MNAYIDWLLSTTSQNQVEVNECHAAKFITSIALCRFSSKHSEVGQFNNRSLQRKALRNSRSLTDVGIQTANRPTTIWKWIWSRRDWSWRIAPQSRL